MKDYIVEYRHFFTGRREIVVLGASSKDEAIERAKKTAPDNYGGNVESKSWRVCAQKDTSKKKWKQVKV